MRTAGSEQKQCTGGVLGGGGLESTPSSGKRHDAEGVVCQVPGGHVSSLDAEKCAWHPKQKSFWMSGGSLSDAGTCRTRAGILAYRMLWCCTHADS